MAYALEWYIKDAIEDSRPSWPINYLKDDMKSSVEMLQHFVNSHSYSLELYGRSITDAQTFNDVDEWMDALIEKKNATKETQPETPSDSLSEV